MKVQLFHKEVIWRHYIKLGIHMPNTEDCIICLCELSEGLSKDPSPSLMETV